MKKLLIMSIALVAIMATVLTVSAFAANTVEITSVTLSKYYDTTEVEGVTTQTLNDAYANVTVNYTVAEDTAGAVDRLTFYLAAQDLASALEGEEAKVIYIDEQVEADAGSLTFVIEKARVKSAISAADTVGTNHTFGTIEEMVLKFKLGGTNIDTAATLDVVYKDPTRYGDLNLDGKTNGKDGNVMAKHVTKREVVTSEEALYCGNMNSDTKVNGKDANILASVIVKRLTYKDMLIEKFAEN